MIRNDLKELLPENWRSMFSHRFCDPENYEVGVFTIEEKEKILVLNPDTLDIMEYFFDDKPDDYWIDLGIILNNKSYFGLYFINKITFKIINRFKQTINVSLTNRLKYPEIRLSSFPKHNFKLHRLIAKLFIANQNPTEFTIVNHKDGNVNNYSINNLEWCSINYNNQSKNRIVIHSKGDNYLYHKYNSEGKLLDIFNSTEEIEKSDPGYRKCLDNGKLKNGVYYKRFEKTVIDYLSRHPIIEGGWYTNKFISSNKIEANLCGVLRIDGKLSLGNFDRDRLVYRIKINNKNILVHRLVFETISGIKIPEGLVIDHIIPVSNLDINNEYHNLKLCTQKENMNNPLTTEKNKIKCSLFNSKGELIKHYDSLNEAKIDLKIKCLNRNYNIIRNSFIFCYDEEIESKLKELIILINKKKDCN